MSTTKLLATLALGAMLLAMVQGCTRNDTLYCDETTPCTDPMRPFCDLNGAFPASAGIGRTCIANPDIGEVDGGLEPKPDAAPMCLASSECPASVPVCENGNCSTCTLGGIGDGECLQRDINLPVCGASGRCQECNSNSDCSADLLAPICDVAVGSCQACEANTECDSGACAIDTGACVLAEDIIYVDTTLGTDSVSCGAQPGSGACKKLSGDQGALAKVSSDRKIVVMAAGTYIEQVIISNKEVQIIGNNAKLLLMNFVAGSTFNVLGGAMVAISDLRIEGGNSIAEGSGLSCIGSNLSLDKVALQSNDDAGLTASDCALDIRGSYFGNNLHQGLEVTAGSSLELRKSVVENNGFQGILAQSSVVQIEQTLVQGNSAGGLRINNSSFLLENNIVAKNGNVSANPASAAGGIAIENGTSKTPQILRHNTVVDNSSSTNNDSAGVVCNTQSGVLAASNIVVNNLRPGADPQFTGSCQFSFSNVGGITSGDGNIDVPPSFVNAGTGDYHLTAGSAGIDLGGATSPTSVDFDGDARPQGAGHDMGADERL